MLAGRVVHPAIVPPRTSSVAYRRFTTTAPDELTVKRQPCCTRQTGRRLIAVVPGSTRATTWTEGERPCARCVEASGTRWSDTVAPMTLLGDQLDDGRSWRAGHAR